MKKDEGPQNVVDNIPCLVHYCCYSCYLSYYTRDPGKKMSHVQGQDDDEDDVHCKEEEGSSCCHCKTRNDCFHYNCE